MLYITSRSISASDHSHPPLVIRKYWVNTWYHTYIYIYTFVYIPLYLYICRYIYYCTYLYIYIYTFVYIYICTFILCPFIYIYICLYLFKYMIVPKTFSGYGYNVTKSCVASFQPELFPVPKSNAAQSIHFECNWAKTFFESCPFK